jgi:hypothetical protein
MVPAHPRQGIIRPTGVRRGTAINKAARTPAPTSPPLPPAITTPPNPPWAKSQLPINGAMVVAAANSE